MSQSPAGWHRDHQDPTKERYWDGAQWTDQYRPAAPMPPQMPVYYAPQPVQKSHTLRNVLIVFAVLTFAGIAGCVALVGFAVNEVDKDNKRPGAADNPLEIVEGQPFEVYGFEYQAGWRLDGNSLVSIEGLKFKNTRDEADSVIADVRVTRGDELLVELTCSSDVAEVGQTVTVDCIGSGSTRGYDKITIQDTF